MLAQLGLQDKVRPAQLLLSASDPRVQPSSSVPQPFPTFRSVLEPKVTTSFLSSVIVTMLSVRFFLTFAIPDIFDICYVHRLFRATNSNPNGVVQVVNISMSEHSKWTMA